MNGNENRWDSFFKPEARSAGHRYFEKGSVSVARPSDTEVTGVIRISSPVRVTLRSPTIESPLIEAQCSCPSGRRAQLCKHIWAVVEEAYKTRADFFDGKSEMTAAPVSEEVAPTKRAGFQSAPRSSAQNDAHEAAKKRQAEYRREQYQKQKARVKAAKGGGKSARVAPQSWPEDVEAAIAYFTQNGYSFASPPAFEEVQTAKKQLSRIFHPDKGGSHAEILELNQHSDVLLDFLEAN